MTSSNSAVPSVIVGISTFNRADALRTSIQSALDQSHRPLRVSVIDDASTDDTPRVRGEFEMVTWERWDHNHGYVRARNQMMLTAPEDYYVSLDDDAWFLQGDEIALALDYLEKHPKVAAVAFDILSPDYPDERERGTRASVALFIGCGHVLRLSAVKALGGYTVFPGAYGAEEKDLCLRLIDTGQEIVRFDGVHVWHDKTSDSSESAAPASVGGVQRHGADCATLPHCSPATNAGLEDCLTPYIRNPEEAARLLLAGTPGLCERLTRRMAQSPTGAISQPIALPRTQLFLSSSSRVSDYLEPLLLRVPRGAMSRARLAFYHALGMKQGSRNRMEGGGRLRRCRQIEIGDDNAFTQGCWLWPEDTDFEGVRIRIGNGNYFNRNLMIDACGIIEIGDSNMFGPDVYITDSNHRLLPGRSPKEIPMLRGAVRIGDNCWIGAKAVILKDVEVGNGSVVAAGAVVTRSVLPGHVVAGAPARSIKTIGSAA